MTHLLFLVALVACAMPLGAQPSQPLVGRWEVVAVHNHGVPLKDRGVLAFTFTEDGWLIAEPSTASRSDFDSDTVRLQYGVQGQTLSIYQGEETGPRNVSLFIQERDLVLLGEDGTKARLRRDSD